MKREHIAGLVFVAIAIGAIIGTVYNADTYASFARAMEHPGREFRIIGELRHDKPILEGVEENTLTLRFHMADNEGHVAEVLHFGPKPHDFERSDEVVLIGSYQGEQFVASRLLLKCPSKYQAEVIGDEATD